MTFENIEVSHIRHALRGMRNPMSGWDKADSTDESVGPQDDELAKRLIRAGQPHRKFMRQISVIVDICKMPAYLMHEFATYKVGTTLDSSSTMHRITNRPLTLEDFEDPETDAEREHLDRTIEALNAAREDYIRLKPAEDSESEDAEKAFRSMKRMLPHSYLYERLTWTCSYENLVEIWKWRHGHRLPAWHQFCEDFIEKLPHAEWITGEWGSVS